MKFNKNQPNVLATWAGRIIKSVALFAVAFAVWSVCNYRLEDLKPEIRDLVLARGSEIVTGSPEELAETLKRDIPKYKKLMVEAGIVPQ